MQRSNSFKSRCDVPKNPVVAYLENDVVAFHPEMSSLFESYIYIYFLYLGNLL